MANLQNINEQLLLARKGAPGEVLTVAAGGEDAEFAPPTGGVGGTGTPGNVAVFTAAGVIGDVLLGSDTTFKVPAGKQGVFALNNVSLITFGGSGFSPTVNGGVASGDAAHFWANVYGRNFLSDIDATVEAPTGFQVKIRVNGSTVLQFPEPTVPTTWTWPIADVAGALQSNGAGVLTFTPLGSLVPYPYGAPAVPNGNNEEFTVDLGAFAVATDVGAPNTRDVNANGNSRVMTHISNNANDALLLTKTLTGVWTGDISVTIQYGVGRVKSSFVGIDFGFLAAGLNSGFIARVDTSAGAVPVLNFSNWTANTNVGLIGGLNAFGNTVEVPNTGFAHLQRVGGTWSIWVSGDGASWVSLGTSASALVVVGGALGIRGFGSTADYAAAVDFVRYNWLFLP